MTYTVVYTDAAQARLTELWVAATDQQGVADSANRIDRELAVDPD